MVKSGFVQFAVHPSVTCRLAGFALGYKTEEKAAQCVFASSAVLQWSGHGDGSSAEEGEQPFTVEYARPQQPRPRLRGTRRRGAGVPVAAAERR